MPTYSTPSWTIRKMGYILDYYGSYEAMMKARKVDPLTGRGYTPVPSWLKEKINADDHCFSPGVRKIRQKARAKQRSRNARKIFWADFKSWLFKRRKIMRAEVYTKPNCPYCVKAKHLLEKQGIPFVEISAVANREALIERVTKTTGAAPRTVPQIYLIDNDREDYVGGYDQLAARYTKE